MVQMLISEGADINYVDKNGRSLLNIVFDYNYTTSYRNPTETIKVLLKAGINPKTDYWILTSAVASQETEALKVLIDVGVDVKGKSGKEALRFAQLRGYTNIIKLLKDAGATD